MVAVTVSLRIEPSNVKEVKQKRKWTTSFVTLPIWEVVKFSYCAVNFKIVSNVSIETFLIPIHLHIDQTRK